MPINYHKSQITSRLALIPARGGSKRLPRKNILPLGGQPMLCWSINAAIKSQLFERICVSTDDAEIALIANNAGAEVLRRPTYLGTDESTVADVCKYHIQDFKDNGITFDHLYCLYPTAPLRNADDLIAMASIFEKRHDAIAVVAVTKFLHYPHQALHIEKNGSLKAFWPQLTKLRGSELPTLVAGNGSTYAVSIAHFLKTLDFTPETGLYAHVMSLMRSIDVDTPDEYELLKAAFAVISQSN